MILPGHRRAAWWLALWCCAAFCGLARGAGAAHQLLSFAGKVEISRSGSTAWEPPTQGMTLNEGDRIRTGPDSRAQVRLSTLAVLPIAESTVITLGGGEKESDGAAFDLQIGRAFFLGNDKPGKVKFRTRSVAGAVRGTEFHLEVSADGTTTLQLFDGLVTLTNSNSPSPASRKP